MRNKSAVLLREGDQAHLRPMMPRMAAERDILVAKFAVQVDCLV